MDILGPLYEDTDTTVEIASGRMLDYQHSMEELDEVLSIIDRTGMVSRHQITSLEALADDPWDLEDYPIEGFTAMPTPTNAGVAMEGLISKAFSGMAKLISGSVKLIIAIIVGIIAVIGKLFSFGSSGKGTATSATTKGNVKTIQSGKKVATTDAIDKSATAMDSATSELFALLAKENVDWSLELKSVEIYSKLCAAGMKQAAELLDVDNVKSTLMDLPVGGKLTAHVFKYYHTEAWVGILTEFYKMPSMMKKLAKANIIKDDFPQVTLQILKERSHFAPSEYLDAEKTVRGLQGLKASKSSLPDWNAFLRGNMDKSALKLMTSNVEGIQEVKTNLKEIEKYAEAQKDLADEFPKLKKEIEAAMQKRVLESGINQGFTPTHSAMFNLINLRVTALRTGIANALLPVMRIAIACNLAITTVNDELDKQLSAMPDRKA